MVTEVSLQDLELAVAAGAPLLDVREDDPYAEVLEQAGGDRRPPSIGRARTT